MTEEHNTFLFKLYKLNLEREKYYLSEHQKRVAFYMGLISALLAATVAGVIKTDEWYYCFMMLLGPAAMIIVSKAAIKGTERFYRVFLETITTLAKIRYDLGMEIQRSDDRGSHWRIYECLIPMRYICDTSDKSKDSQQWVNTKIKEGYQKVTAELFNCTKTLAYVLIATIIVIGIMRCIDTFPVIIDSLWDCIDDFLDIFI